MKYRVAVIGRTGRGDYGHGIDVVWREVADCEIVAVADDNKMGLAAAAKRLSLPERSLYSDYRRMLDEVKPQIVAICQRWLDQHRDMVVAAAQRGIHIYMEKPLCRTLAEADEMVDACERTHVKMAVAHQTKYSPKLETIKKLIAEGRIGQILEFRGRGKEDSRGGGEDLWVLGSHIMDLIRYFGGDAKWCAAQVTQNGRPVTAADVREGNEGIGPLAGDAVRAMYGLAGGATAYFASQKGMAGSPSRFGLSILGSRGVIEVVTGYLPSVKLLADPSWSPGRSGARWQDVSSAGVAEPEPLKDGGLAAGNVAAVKDLIESIEKNRQPKSSLYEARAAIEMIIATFESHRTRGLVELPLKNRQNPLAMLK
jgi:predicted dehydrogenase